MEIKLVVDAVRCFKVHMHVDAWEMWWISAEWMILTAKTNLQITSILLPCRNWTYQFKETHGSLAKKLFRNDGDIDNGGNWEV